MSLDHCPFCRTHADWRLPAGSAYSRARCTCGAVGVWFGIPADADEGADDLLDELGLDPLPAVQPVPIGTSGMMSAAPYNTPATLAALEQRLRQHGYLLELVQRRLAQGSPSWAIWARATSPPA